ncbi:hypothetical protein AVEN_3418-1 [Araneus ventricosus]|uniref:Uncharacterized protein n=1 Tax=Araneus ventricosus TaxID=182803 RepID=A0A4Y2I5I9_ARAVE|nr:hypothetical protein AVEN_3418-1 [Araneus ventricosus]
MHEGISAKDGRGVLMERSSLRDRWIPSWKSNSTKDTTRGRLVGFNGARAKFGHAAPKQMDNTKQLRMVKENISYEKECVINDSEYKKLIF